MHILYDNYVTSATITASTEATDYTFNVGLKDDRLSRVCRTTSDTSQYIRFTTTSVSATKILIVGHNLTSGATITLNAYSTSDYNNDPVLVESLTWGTDYIYKEFTCALNPYYVTDESGNNIVDENGNLIYGNTGLTSYIYWELAISDASNPDGYIEISKIFLGPHLEVYMDTGIQIPSKSSSQSSKTPSGQLYANRGVQLKAAKFNLSDIEQADRVLINTFWETVDICVPFWILIWEDDLTVEPPLYCALTKSLEWSKAPIQGNIWSVSMEVEEAK